MQNGIIHSSVRAFCGVMTFGQKCLDRMEIVYERQNKMKRQTAEPFILAIDSGGAFGADECSGLFYQPQGRRNRFRVFGCLFRSSVLRIFPYETGSDR